MPLLTKLDIANLANRVRASSDWAAYRQSEREDFKLAADALLALSELVAVAWPIAIGD